MSRHVGFVAFALVCFFATPLPSVVGQPLASLRLQGAWFKQTDTYSPTCPGGPVRCAPDTCTPCVLDFCIPFGNATIGKQVYVALNPSPAVLYTVQRIYDSATNGICIPIPSAPLFVDLVITEFDGLDPVIKWFGWADSRESWDRKGWPYYYDRNGIGNVVSWSLQDLASLENAFSGLPSVTVPTSLPPAVRNLKGMFRNVVQFNSNAVSSWSTAQVTDFASMFEGASAFNQPLAGFDVSAARDMRNMFFAAFDFAQSLVSWCVPQFAEEPAGFRFGATRFRDILAPSWGTCPQTSSVNDIPIQPYPKLNTFCAGPLIDAANNPTCQFMLQSGLAFSPTRNVPEGETIYIKVYTTKNMPAITKNSSLDDSISPLNSTYAPGASFSGTPKVPDEITFYMPYCMKDSIYALDAQLNAELNSMLIYTNAGTTVRETVQRTPLGCEGDFLLNYATPCSSNVEYSIYDTHCSATPSSFADCVNSQQLVDIVLPAGTTNPLLENVTKAYAPAVFDNLGRRAFPVRPKCALSGTNQWQSLYGTAFERLRGTGVSPSDPGQQAPFWATMTYKIRDPAACSVAISNSPSDGLFFRGKVIGRNYTADALSAIPVRLRFDATDPNTERTAYIPYASCEPNYPRPALSSSISPEIWLQPFCRVVSPDGTIVSPLIDGLVVYQLATRNIPFPNARIWASVKFEYPTNPSLNEETPAVFVGGNDNMRAWIAATNRSNTDIHSAKVYLKTFSPDNDWKFLFYESEITGIPQCRCAGQYLDLPNVICQSINQVAVFSGNSDFTEPLFTPQCTQFLLDGYMGDPSVILRNKIQTLGAIGIPRTGSTYNWDFSINTPGLVQVQDQDVYTSTIPFLAFRVIKKVATIKIRMRITSDSGVTNFCDIMLNVEEGAPVAQVSPASLLISVGSNATLDASRSYATTDEVLTWSWSVSYASNQTGLLLLGTGNVTTNTVVGLYPGSYRVTVFVCNPRTCRGVSVSARVVVGEVIQRNITSTNCVSSLTNGEELDPLQPPIPRASVQIFSKVKAAARMFSLVDDYEYNNRLRQNMLQDTATAPGVIDETDAASITFIAIISSLVGASVLIALVYFVIGSVNMWRSARESNKAKASLEGKKKKKTEGNKGKGDDKGKGKRVRQSRSKTVLKDKQTSAYRSLSSSSSSSDSADEDDY